LRRIATEGKQAPVDQKHLNTKVSIANITAEVENDQRESARKLTGTHGVSTKEMHAILHRPVGESSRVKKKLASLTLTQGTS
jgi:hypothetical protein